MQHPGFDRISREDYLGDLPARPLADVRAMRAECQGVEADLSYLRRLVQGRLDIVAGEARRRAEGSPRAGGSDLVASLADTLSERTPGGPGRGSFTGDLGPSSDADGLAAELDAVCDGQRLAELDQLDDEQVDELAGALQGLEREVSTRRSSTFGLLDQLSAEITRRYRDGEASVDTLLRE